MDEEKFPDDDVYVVVECLKCKEMCSFGSFGIERICPGMPVYCTYYNECSNCMNSEIFKMLTNH